MLWLQALSARLADPEWAADVGVPLLIALAALFFAYYSLRVQVRHARDLAADDRRVRHLQDLSRNLLEIMASIQRTPIIDFPRQGLGDDIRRRVDASVNASEAFLGSEVSFEQIRALALDVSQRHRICANMLEEVKAHPLAKGYAAHNVIIDSLDLLSDASVSLARWNGHGRAPTLPIRDLSAIAVAPLPFNDSNGAYVSWAQAVRDDLAYELNQMGAITNWPRRGWWDLIRPLVLRLRGLNRD